MPKRLLYFLVFFVLGTIAVAGGALPREFSFVLLAASLIYVVALPLSEAAPFTIIAIPLYLALPITPSFDSMSSWRFVVAALFAAWFIKSYPRRSIIAFLGSRRFFPKLLSFEWIALALGALAFVSLFGAAQDAGPGIKKLIFLANIGALYVVVRSLAQENAARRQLFLSAAIAGGIALTVGFLQYFLIFFFSLYDFWKGWASSVIPAFYGHALGELLSTSNTWFSYYASAPPTLRMFSVFPDSHSFGMFMMLASCFALAEFIMCKKISFDAFLANARRMRIGRRSAPILLSFALWFGASLTIYFSGSRGIWLGAVMLALCSILILLLSSERLRLRRRLLLPLFFFGIGAPLSMYLANNLSLLIAFGACQRSTPFLCSPLITSIFDLPGSIIFVFFLLILSFLAGIITAWIWRRALGPVFAQRFGFVLVSFLAFMLLFPVASSLSSRTHGFGVEIDKEMFAFERAKSILDLTETSNRARLDIWRLSAQAMLERPFLGVGFGNYPVVLEEALIASRRGASAHNLYLDFGAELGLGGFVLVFLFFGAIVRLGWRLAMGVPLREASSGEGFGANAISGNEFFAPVFGALVAIYIIWIFGYNFFDVVLLNDKVALLWAVLMGLFARSYLTERSVSGASKE